MIEKIYELKHKMLFYWHKWWLIIVSAAIAAMLVLIAVLLLREQKEVGAREAGYQIAKLAQNIRNHYKMRPDYWGLSTKEVIAKEIYPLDMNINNDKLIGYFANEVEVGADKNGTAVMPTVQSFVIAYNGLNKAQCIGLASNKFDQEFWLGIESMNIINDKKDIVFDWSSNQLVLPANEKLVKNCCQNENNTIIFKFK